MRQIEKILLMSLTVASLCSCRQGLLDTAPYDGYSSENMWTTDVNCEQGVTGIYSALRKDYVAAKPYYFETFGVSSTCRDNDYALLKNTSTSSDGLFSDYWKQHYEGISRANDAIDHLAEAPISEDLKSRLIAESKFLRAFFYYKLNMVYRGVPLYLTTVTSDDALTYSRSSEMDVWNAIITDLTDCINCQELPDRYQSGDSEYGHVTKSAAYALRGKVYLWMKDWAKAESDFKIVGEMGHALFQGGYKELFKEANEQCDEMIFSLQCIDQSGYGNDISFRYGGRTTFGSCWNTYLVSTDFVDSYENKDGSTFEWDAYLPGYSSMTTADREVFFLRDSDPTILRDQLTAEGYKGDMDALILTIQEAVDKRLNLLSPEAQAKYLANGNEARIKSVYENRDPRLINTVITPYSTYDGSGNSIALTFTSRWPYVGYDTEAPYDLRTDTQSHYYYLFRKLVAEGTGEMSARDKSPIDIPIIRYADVLLGLAEALNEQGKTDEAISVINQVRQRAGVADLTTADVSGKDEMRVCIQNERRWEFAGEGVTFFDELRWNTWKDQKFNGGDGTAGMKEMWGTLTYSYTWGGDQYNVWPIPKKEIDMNINLQQNSGW